MVAPFCARARREVAGAAAQIECAVARLDLRQSDHAAFPEPVQAKALQVVDQVVTPCDGGEKVIDPGGALFTGVVEGIAHATSLAQCRVEKSKLQKYGFAKSDCFGKVACVNCTKRMD